MTKSKMLKIIDNFIESNTKALTEVSEEIAKFVDSPRIICDLTDVQRNLTYNLNSLSNSKKAIEDHSKENEEIKRVYDMPSFDDGIVFDEEEED